MKFSKRITIKNLQKKKNKIKLARINNKLKPSLNPNNNNSNNNKVLRKKKKLKNKIQINKMGNKDLRNRRKRKIKKNKYKLTKIQLMSNLFLCLKKFSCKNQNG